MHQATFATVTLREVIALELLMFRESLIRRAISRSGRCSPQCIRRIFANMYASDDISNSLPKTSERSQQRVGQISMTFSPASASVPDGRQHCTTDRGSPLPGGRHHHKPRKGPKRRDSRSGGAVAIRTANIRLQNAAHTTIHVWARSTCQLSRTLSVSSDTVPSLHRNREVVRSNTLSYRGASSYLRTLTPSVQRRLHGSSIVEHRPPRTLYGRQLSLAAS